MKKLVELLDQVDSLENSACVLESALTQVVLVGNTETDGTHTFPKKHEVLESMANAIQKMREIAGQLYAISDDLKPQNGVELS